MRSYLEKTLYEEKKKKGWWNGLSPITPPKKESC
jgi:hypothetical protein